MGSNNFYFAFEAKHRGSRELIKSRQQVYIPFVQQLQLVYADCSALDLGCGRGEWLELMQEHGVAAKGIDLNDDMVSACKNRGFAVEKRDALAVLKELPDESVCVISGFHIAEHIPFDVLQDLVKEAKRVLRPAGLLILETPNPENPVVGSCNFYTDPSHIHPLPPTLLSFLPEYENFARVKVLRLQEDPALHNAEQIALIQAVAGASPDYAVIAQKNADLALLSPFDNLFSKEYGLTIGGLCDAYDMTVRKIVNKGVSILYGKENSPYPLGSDMLSAATAGVSLDNFFQPESWGRWAGAGCKIHIFCVDFSHITGDIYLSFACHIFHSPRNVHICINGQEIFAFRAETEKRDLRIKVPAGLLQDNSLLEFIPEEPVFSPKSAGLGEGDRELFIAFEYLKFDEDYSVRFAGLEKRNNELYGLIINTRHRTLYGACAWLFHKIFKSRT